MTHELNTRSKDDSQLVIPDHNAHFFVKSFSVNDVREWNQLPKSIRDLTSHYAFQKRVKAHLFSVAAHP
ncbi:hypothetical protein PR048_018960 [Dryococelus australis]|uniref:Uncharacterized protein n=1 Tax=Dryococelus australis TaxID=614101 RepID=A0ABQ9H249_9NEOP|nr:hypothetical protein PR048_018960 [Dryococelus australis]